MAVAEEHTTMFETDDMALATFLLMRGWSHSHMIRRGQAALWVYQPDGSSDELNEDVREYFRGEAYVEPKEFMRKVKLVRSELFEFLGIKPKGINDV